MRGMGKNTLTNVHRCNIINGTFPRKALFANGFKEMSDDMHHILHFTVDIRSI